MKALAVFFDPEGARYQWLLRPGFRHVFCAVSDGQYWTTFDARVSGVVVDTIQAESYPLAEFYWDNGYTVAAFETGPRLRTPFVVANCVGLVKAVCGVRAPFAVTPWQLFQHLTKGPA